MKEERGVLSGMDGIPEARVITLRRAASNKRKNNKHGEGTGGIDRCGGFCEGHRGLYTLAHSLRTERGGGKRAGANTFKASE